MKALFLFVILSSLWLGSQAQKKGSKDNPVWFNLEVKGGIGTSLLSNKNISGDKNISAMNFNFYPAYGIGIGAHIKNYFAVQIEKSWSSFGQKYTYKNESPARTLVFNSSEMGLFLRKTSEGGGFVGLGFKVANISKSNVDSISVYSKSLNFLNFEIGGPVWQNNMFDINLNIRFGYGLNNMVSAENYNPGAYTVYTKNASTHPITAQFLIGFNWHVGYWATSNCKHKGFVFFLSNS